MARPHLSTKIFKKFASFKILVCGFRFSVSGKKGFGFPVFRGQPKSPRLPVLDSGIS
jgi:hypothetical protein